MNDEKTVQAELERTRALLAEALARIVQLEEAMLAAGVAVPKAEPEP